MNQNLQRLSVQITKHQYNLLKHHTNENVKYEEYEKYMAAQQAAGIKEPAIADASSIF
jgi:hypothetical protein